MRAPDEGTPPGERLAAVAAQDNRELVLRAFTPWWERAPLFREPAGLLDRIASRWWERDPW